MAKTSLYDAVGGGDVLLRLCEAWHERCLAHPIASHPFSHGVHPDHTARLAAYLAEALGGPPTFSESVSSEREMAVVHAGNGPHAGLNDIAVELFEASFDDAGVPDDAEVRAALAAYWRWSTDRLDQPSADAEALPSDAPVVRWGWDGTRLTQRSSDSTASASSSGASRPSSSVVAPRRSNGSTSAT